MSWSDIPPIEPGYYWMNYNGGTEIVEVCIDDRQTGSISMIVHAIFDESEYELDHFNDAKWFGPIVKPDSKQ